MSVGGDMSGGDDQTGGTPEAVETESTAPIAVADPDAVVDGKAPETVNLVSTIDEDEQKKIAEAVFSEYETDWKDSEKYRQKRAELYKLCFGIMPAKEEGYSQIHYSIMLRAVIKLHARVYDQQFPSNGEYWGCRPSSANDLDRCVRVAKHMNWQTLHQIPEYVPNHDALIMQWYINGDALTYMYWSPVKNRPCHEWLATDDYVLPYAFPREAADPSLSELPRITRIVRKYKWGPDGLEELAASGYYDANNVAAMFSDEQDGRSGGTDAKSDQTESPTRQAVDKGSGVEKPGEGKTGQRVLLEQHRWWKLPEWTKYRPVIATIDKDTKKLLAFILREDEDPEDRARYNREKLANDASYQAAMVQYENDLQMYLAGMPMPSQGMDGTGMPAPGAAGMTAPPDDGAASVSAPPEPGAATMTGPSMPGATTLSQEPQPPEKPPLPDPPRMVPINFFTHYVCIPNPEGIYGYGIGYLLEGNNVTADALGSIIVDSGKLSNMPTGIYSREAKMRGGEVKIKPGEFVPVDCLPGELDKLFHQFKFPGPEPQLSNIIKDQMADAEEVSGASEVLSGEVGGSNETATTTQIRISQALAAISIQNKRYTRARTEEGKKLARLNSVYLGDEEYFSEIDPFHRMPPVDRHVARADYLEDTAITVTADPRMASQPQRLQEAMQALQVIMQLAQAAPWLQNPQLIGAAVKNIFVAMDRPDLAAFAEPPPPPPPPPPGALPPGGPQPGQGGPPPAAGRPGAGAPLAPQGAPQGPRAGQPRPSPQRPGPTVPNGGPGAPANGPFMQQGA